MSVALTDLLLALTLFQIKHLIADFLLQTRYMVRTKGQYGHPGGLAHAGLHGLMSLPALWALGPGPGWILFLAGVEVIVHYHVDWGKEKLGRSLGAAPDQARFWHLLGADQFIHQLTYICLLLGALLVA